jgi:hypothetical protein
MNGQSALNCALLTLFPICLLHVLNEKNYLMHLNQSFYFLLETFAYFKLSLSDFSDLSLKWLSYALRFHLLALQRRATTFPRRQRLILSFVWRM